MLAPQQPTHLPPGTYPKIGSESSEERKGAFLSSLRVRKATGKAKTLISTQGQMFFTVLTGPHPATPSEFRVRRFGCGEVERAGGAAREKRARAHPVTFLSLGQCPHCHTLLAGPSKAQLLLHPKGTEAGRPATPKVRGHREGSLPLHCPSFLGEISTQRRHSAAADWHNPALPQLLLPWGPHSYN